MSAIDRERISERIHSIIEWAVIHEVDPIEELNRLYEEIQSGAFDVREKKEDDGHE